MRFKKISTFFPQKNHQVHKDVEMYEVLNSIPIPIFIKDTQGVYTNCNTEYESFIGLERDQIIGKSAYDLVPRNLADIYHEKDEELFRQNTVQIYENRMTIKGVNRDVVFHKSVYRDSLGHIGGLVGAIIDHTEQKKAEQLLRERIAFEKIVSKISADCLKANLDTHALILNALGLVSRFVGVDNSYIYITSSDGRRIKETYHWNVETDISIMLDADSSIYQDKINSVVQDFDRKQEQTTCQELYNEKSKQMILSLKSEQEWIGFMDLEWIKDRSLGVNTEHTTLLKLIAEIFVGMLQRQRTEESLRVSEEKNKILLEAIPDVMTVVTPTFRIIDFKRAKDFEHIGDTDSFVGKTASEVLPEDAAELFMKNISLAFQTRKITSFEYQIIYKDEIRYREARVVVISNENALILIRDITERKIAEEEIHKLSFAVEQSPGGIVISDVNENIVYVNSKFSQISGYSLDELKGQNMSVLKSNMHPEEFYENVRKTIISGNEWRGEICNRRKNGELYWSLVSLSPVSKLDGKTTYYLGISQDITEKKLIEEMLHKRNAEIKDALHNLEQTQMQLIQQEKLAGIGQLAAGVAHEMNNPLGFVLSNFDILKQYLGKITDTLSKYRELKDRVLESKIEILQDLTEEIVSAEKEKKIGYILEDIEPIIQESDEGLKRVSDIVKALKVFSRVDRNNEFESCDLNTGIRNTLMVAKNEIKYIADIQINLKELPLLRALAGQINQVLLNIILNAAYAIKEKQMDQLGMIKITSYHDDQFVYCEIQDDGIGMTEETSKNIFNPFFTTKPVGQGTGLGLSISYDIIVNKHQGEISVVSEKEIGTTFTIKLPLYASDKDTE